MTATKRQTELDILRLLATLAVIMIHGGLGIQTDIEIVKHIYYGIHAAIVWCVPVFFMISGRFFLDPERNVPLRKILTKYIPHIITVFIFWTAVYTAYYKLSGAYDDLNIFGIMTQFIEGPYHFWYLYTLVGLYIITPFLRKIAENKQLLVYFLILFVILNVTTEYLVYLPKVGDIIQSFADKFCLSMVIGYVGYFMLGYFLWSIKDSVTKRRELILYVIGIMFFIGTILAEALVSPELREADFVKQYMKPNVVIYSTILYLFFIKRVSKINFSERAVKILAFLTEMGFGIYCVHALVNELFQISLPCSSLRVICIYLISLVLTYLIRKIPYIGKKIT